MKQKLLILFACLLGTLSAWADDDPNKTIYYTTSDKKVLNPKNEDFGARIKSNTYTNNQGKIVFDADVTKMGTQVFHDCSKLTSITIPSSVTSIGSYAFDYCI